MEEVLFELVSETDEGRQVVNHFVMAHAYETDDEESHLWVN